MKFLRLLTKTAAAQTLGADACWLLTIVVCTEDVTHYKRGVTFYTGQLLPLLSFGKWERLDAARKRAVDAGWLNYEAPAPGSRKPGTYWVTIPQWAKSLSDSWADEGTPAYPDLGDCEDSQYPDLGDVQLPRSPERSPGAYPDLGDALGEPPSLPLHTYNPNKGKHTRRGGVFVVPSVEEVAGYAKEINSSIDATYFIDYWTARDWKFNRGGKMKDWKATLRNWKHMDTQRSNGNGTGRTNGRKPGAYRGGPGEKFDPTVEYGAGF
jgi:hypothetical protein